MAEQVNREFPLFPLGLVALPGELIPLHIFEERFKTMMSECLEHEKEFGIVWLSDDGLRDIGCACEIERVLERLEDGRINLLARGTRPFRAGPSDCGRRSSRPRSTRRPVPIGISAPERSPHLSTAAPPTTRG